jgi:hypothetical protein
VVVVLVALPSGLWVEVVVGDWGGDVVVDVVACATDVVVVDASARALRA